MDDGRIGELYTAYVPAIFARCLRILRNRDAAEDATQEAFLRAHKQLRAAPDDRQSFAWVYRIATNLCLSILRDQTPVVELPEDLSRSENVEDLLANRELARRVVMQAPEKYRMAAWLHYVEGMNLEESAEVMGVTSRTITNWVAAFLAEARKSLGVREMHGSGSGPGSRPGSKERQ